MIPEPAVAGPPPDRGPAARTRLKPSGYALGSTLRGHFKVEGIGAAQLYIEADTPPFIVIRGEHGVVVVNDEDPQRTHAMFEQMHAQWRSQ